MTLTEDLHDLIEAYIDGEADPALWQQALAEHGTALEEAVMAARARRAAIAALDRPSLPPHLQQALRSHTVASQSPSRSLGLLWGLPILATAAVLVLIWQLDWTSAPTAIDTDLDDQPLAIMDRRTEDQDLPVFESHDALIDHDETGPSPRSRQQPAIAVDPEALVLGDEAGSALAAEPQAAPPPALDEAQEEPLTDEALAGLRREAEAFREDIRARPRRMPAAPQTLSRAAKADPPPPSTGLAAVMQLLTTVDGMRHLLVVIHNGGHESLTSEALDLRLEGLDADGRKIWSQAPANLDELLLEPDQSHTMQLQLGRDITPPARVTALRLAFGSQQSETLELDVETDP